MPTKTSEIAAARETLLQGTLGLLVLRVLALGAQHGHGSALAIGAGHSFVVFLEGGFPVNVLNALKQVPEVCGIFCATANEVEVVVATTELGRGIVGVVDGRGPAGVEAAADVEAREQLLRRLGYKL